MISFVASWMKDKFLSKKFLFPKVVSFEIEIHHPTFVKSIAPFQIVRSLELSTLDICLNNDSVAKAKSLLAELLLLVWKQTIVTGKYNRIIWRIKKFNWWILPKRSLECAPLHFLGDRPNSSMLHGLVFSSEHSWIGPLCWHKIRYLFYFLRKVIDVDFGAWNRENRRDDLIGYNRVTLNTLSKLFHDCGQLWANTESILQIIFPFRKNYSKSKPQLHMTFQYS